ncbi:MAG: bifunctional hydroxymethylpyrimidine kinase/phosphomethylpyrimidine kinase [Pseudonocardiaceae bacterium]
MSTANSAPIACLTIGSSDSVGGAGIQGDIKAFASIGCYAATVVVGVTAQNTIGVRTRCPIPLDVISDQLGAVLDDLPIRAIKVGTTWSVEVVELIGAALAAVEMPVVLDPVMVTAAGGWLSGDGDRIRRTVIDVLFPIADVITPNLREAELLAGSDPGKHNHRELAERLARLGARSVVVSSSRDQPGDWFFDGNRHYVTAGMRHDVDADHGAGCAHSALLAGLLGRGVAMRDAVEIARDRAGAAVLFGLTHLGGGAHPVDTLGLAARYLDDTTDRTT